jgi:hypothetical protein
VWMARLDVHSSYLGDLFGPMIIIALGLGLAFVPLTLTAVVGVAREDSGVASAVLNTMQQVGGALGLATLSTVASNAARDRGATLGAQLQQQVASGQLAKDRIPAAQALIGPDSFTHGATSAFVVGAGMILGAAVLVYLLLRIRHDALANDGVTPTAGDDRRLT